jgi:hypothetical protein
MDNAKVDEVLDSIIRRLGEDGYTPQRWPAECPLPEDSTADVTALRHALWLAAEARTWGAERIEKKFRWLGFIQGILWMTGESTIEAAKNANKPEEK